MFKLTPENAKAIMRIWWENKENQSRVLPPRGYRNYAVELHVDRYDVFTHEFSEESTSRRCFDRVAAILQEPLYEARLWHKNKVIASKSIR